MITNRRIRDLLPPHYSEYYPRFIKFLEKYYEWFYRVSGLSDKEVADLRKDTSWLQHDIDRFINTGQLRYLSPINTVNNDPLTNNIVILNNTGNAGGDSSHLQDRFTLDEDLAGYITNKGELFTDAGATPVELSSDEDRILDSWFNSMGLDRIKRSRLTALNSIDQVLLLSLLKHIYGIKGTEASIKLFFNLFFDEDVSVYQPKKDIASLDDNWVLEYNQLARDDNMYQEYSYVILVSQDLTVYQEIFNSIYIKTIHPSGFKVTLVKGVAPLPFHRLLV